MQIKLLKLKQSVTTSAPHSSPGGGCSDPLTNTDYKEPPIVCYESIPKDISVTLRTDEQRI